MEKPPKFSKPPSLYVENHQKHQLLAGAIRISKPQVFRRYLLDLFFGGGDFFYDFVAWDSSPFCTTTMWESIFFVIV